MKVAQVFSSFFISFPDKPMYFHFPGMYQQNTHTPNTHTQTCVRMLDGRLLLIVGDHLQRSGRVRYKF